MGFKKKKTLGFRQSYNASREEGDPLIQSRPYNLMVQTSARKEKTYPEFVVFLGVSYWFSFF